MSFWEILLLAVAVSMDAFAVSVGKGLSVQKISWRGVLSVALWFGGFQALMPVIGYYLGVSFADLVEKIDHWIAFALLAFIGGNMIREGLSGDDSPEVIDHPVYAAQLALQGVATAIDALSVGLTIAEYTFMTALISAIIVGIVTYLVCIVGLRIGKKLGESIGGRASVLGGCILILIGIKVLLDHYL